jgi:hypothetical protein
MAALAQSDQVTWAADRFYWAILDGASLRAARRMDARRLSYLFEEHVPIEIDSLHIVFARAADGHWIGCAAEHEQLAGLPSGTTRLYPEAVPAFVAPLAQAEDFNLLVGRHEPAAAARARRRCAAVALAGLVVASALFTIGLSRRAARDAALAASTDELRRTAIVQALDVSENIDPSIALLSALRSLRQTRAPRDASEPFDAARMLEQVFRAWPAELTVKVESLSVTSSGVTLTGLAPASEVADALAGALRSVPGWGLLHPQFEARADGVSFSMRLTPKNP